MWFCDESGFAADTQPHMQWAKKGSRPVWYYQGDHIRSSVIGAVNPSSGDLEALIMPFVDGQIFQQFLDYLKRRTKKRSIYLVLDNASWHKAKGLKWGNIIPLYLPPYSPDLNPIEELWRVMKDRFCYNIPPVTYEELDDRIEKILRYYFKKKSEVKSICKVHY